ncbi:hypothetical protein TTHERM_00259340 (macronuclear) [Tetrahymena thermophila SB210]|uniref:Uncharacterized protein n=1 Tax=Tetrahymena thermophila (strain SB210) TaxID=312017 RepID=Q22UE8_TETTS|nr:hypothetical protein TTHERM_00259340 [Tetrahymena thermophila SB210]EAR88739.1 hypothetical protein TTHERM_00259340 [Tetrahymena thermophila SB210]|eukprot:XP_001008984.1 hypothetical protein TTHERM_00259340 [Tetrahymena thermophila SB210]
MSQQLISLFLDIVSQFPNDTEFKQNDIFFPIQQEITNSFSNFSDIQQNTLLNSQQSYGLMFAQNPIQQNFDMDYQFQQKQNVIKNIIKGFSKYLKSLSNEKAMQRFSGILGSHKNITNIKKNFLREMKKKNNRWNYILKRMISSKNLSKIFYSYLEKESNDWLFSSKTDDIISHQQMINLIKEALQQEVQVNIKTYKKK